MSEYKAGPEFNALIAEKVMGWKIGEGWQPWPGGCLERIWVDNRGRKQYSYCDWSPSTNITYAWRVLVKMKNYLPSLQWNGSGSYWFCTFDNGGQVGCTDPTAPMAVCLAALKVIEANEK